MRAALWPDEIGVHAQEIARYFSGPRSNSAEVLVACLGSGTPIGFVELSIRAREGGSTDRVACVEGWFVEAAYRDSVIDAGLIAAAEEWGRVSGCVELASDVRYRSAGSPRTGERQRRAPTSEA
jgi:aminoglycoside 6'-N-acetyltransferase I